VNTNRQKVEPRILKAKNVATACAGRVLAVGLIASFAATAAGCGGPAGAADPPAPPDLPEAALAAEPDGGSLTPNDFITPIRPIVPCWFTSGNETLQLTAGGYVFPLIVRGQCFEPGTAWVEAWDLTNGLSVTDEVSFANQQGTWIGISVSNEGTFSLTLPVPCGDTYMLIGYDPYYGYETSPSVQTVKCPF
jgi:hypothetical protein